MRANRWTGVTRLLSIVVGGTLVTACVRNPPPVEPDVPPPPLAPAIEESTARPTLPSAPPSPPAIVGDDDFKFRNLEELNRDSPLRAVFFDYDSTELNSAGLSTLDHNADVLRRYATWIITIEGHCDERGTPEYNLGLGERRAVVVREYLLTLGFDAVRIQTISYGKEFPFDPGHNEEAWANNRRAHFVITEH